MSDLNLKIDLQQNVINFESKIFEICISFRVLIIWYFEVIVATGKVAAEKNYCDMGSGKGKKKLKTNYYCLQKSAFKVGKPCSIFMKKEEHYMNKTYRW